MPGRLGPRFALEAGFLILLAIGAGLADLRPAFIVIVMAAAWVLVALLEFTAQRLAATYRFLYRTPLAAPPVEPARSSAVEEVARQQAERESATVVTPPSDVPEEVSAPVGAPSAPPVAEAEAPAEPPAAEGDIPAGEPAAGGSPSEPRRLEPLQPRPKRRWFRRPGPARKAKETEPLRDTGAPSHVRLLPRPPEPSRASKDVAEIFDAREHDQRDKRRAR